MRSFFGLAGQALKGAFESLWNYLGSLAAVSLFAAVLGLGIFHAVVQDGAPRVHCYAGVCNTPGAEPPEGIMPLGQGDVSGVPHVRLEYGEQGLLQRMRYVNAEGSRTLFPGSRVADQRFYYTPGALPRLSRKENRGLGGQLAEDAQGVAVRAFDYDAGGRLVRTRFLNAEEKPVQPRFPGYAECRRKYDGQGRLVEVLYLGEDGRPVVNAEGEQQVSYVYEDDGGWTRRNYVNGQLAAGACGVAVEVLRPCGEGMCRSWYDAGEKAVMNQRVGAASMHSEQVDGAGVRCCRYLDTGGMLRHCARVCAEQLMRCNPAGLPEWECFAAADGMPVVHPVLGYAERVCEYTPSGELEREYFWDAAGHPAPVCEARHVPTAAGMYTLRLHSDGSSSVQPQEG